MSSKSLFFLPGFRAFYTLKLLRSPNWRLVLAYQSVIIRSAMWKPYAYGLALTGFGAAVQKLDAALFKCVNHNLACPVLDYLMLASTWLGVGTVQSGASLLLIFLGYVLNRDVLRRAGFAGLYAFALSGLGVQIAKLIWNRPRPPMTLFDVRLIDVPRFAHSFPSGHSMTTFAVCAALSTVFPMLRPWLLSAACVTAISRVYLGVHYPLDVIYGALWGLLIGVACAKAVMKGAPQELNHSVPDKRDRDSKATLRLLGGFCLASFFWRLGVVPLIGLDESLYAECSREMLASGDFVIPRVNGEFFFDKPPLAYWLQAASMAGLGVSSFAVRFPSALAVTALAFFTYWLAARLFDRRSAGFAAFALAANMLTVAMARLCSLDGLFALWITVSLGLFLLSYQSKIGNWGYAGSWAAAGLSVLTKGPAGVVVIAAVTGLFLLLRRKSKPFPGAWGAWSVLMFIISIPWFVMVQIKSGGTFFGEFVIHQNLQRALGQDFQHNQAFWFYAPVFLAGFFPWSVMLPAASLRLIRLQPEDDRGEAVLFAAVWVAVVFVIFSAFRSKLPTYIFPMYPSAALLVGALWSGADQCPQTTRRVLGAAALVAVAIFGGMFVALRYLPQPIPGLGPALMCMGSALAVGAVAALILNRLRRPTQAFAALAASMLLFTLAATGLGLPSASKTLAEPPATIGRALRDWQGTIYAVDLKKAGPAIAFYARQPIRQITPEALRIRMRKSREALVVAQVRDAALIPHGARLLMRIGPLVVYRL